MQKETKIHVGMVVCTIFWAGAFIAGKIGMQEFSAFGITFFRFLFATILIFAILIKQEKGNLTLEKSLWPLVIILGIVGMFGYHILFFTSLKYTSAVNSSIIGATNPLITSILAALFLNEKLSYRSVGAVLLAFSGVLLTATNGRMEVLKNLSFNNGDLIMLTAVFCWAVYSLLGKKARGRVSPLKMMAYVFLVCLILLIPFVIIEKIWLQLPYITWKGWISVIYMAVFPSVLGYLIQMISIQEIGAGRTSIYINLVPVFSMILSYFILHEPLSLVKVFATGMIITGVYLSSNGKKLSQKKVEINR